MRVKINTNIIENQKPNKTRYKHELYSMVLANIQCEKACNIHLKNRSKRLFTFSDIYIKDDKLHFYISGEDSLIQDFVNNIMFNQIVRLGDKVLKVVSIDLLDSLKNRDVYRFKTNFIVNQMEDGKVALSKDISYMCRRIGDIITDKYNQINNENLKNDLEVEILSITKKYNRYKDHHLNCWKAIIQIKGDYKLVKALYDLGIGENTASGHGFVWEE